jgi:hypothetical protein
MTRWHRPGTLAVDRAREVARTCWEALAAVDMDTAQAIAHAAALAGEGWLSAQPATHTEDDYVSVSTAAELVGRSVRWVYAWVAENREARSRVDRAGRITVRVGDVRDAARR